MGEFAKPRKPQRASPSHRYHSYTEGNGPFLIWGEQGKKGDPQYVHRHESARRVAEIWGQPEVLYMPECDGSAYSDRLHQWDHEKYVACAEKHLTGQWYTNTPSQLSAFLSEYMGRPIQAVTLWQYNNVSSGFPVWLIFYRYLPTPEAQL